MKKKIIGIFVMMLFLISACGSATNEKININITNMESEYIEFFIEFDDLPETLIFNQEGVQDWANEYSWSVYIDTDGDVNTGSTWVGLEGKDTLLVVYNIKKEGGEQHEGTILSNCEFTTMKWDSRGWFSGAHTIFSKSVDTERNIIVLYCSKTWSEISNIDMSDSMFISASHISAEGWEFDSASGYGLVTDNTGETNYSFIDIVRGGISMPTAPIITGELSGKAGKEMTYAISSTDFVGNDLYYYVEWGDGEIDEWIGPYAPGEEIEITHIWEKQGDYTITARAKSTKYVYSNWTTLEVSMPKNKAINTPFLNFLENHPHLFPLLRQLLGLEI